MNPSKFLPIIGLMLFIYVVISNNPGAIASAFLSISLPWLLLSIALSFCVLFLKGLKWKAVIRLHNLDYPLGSCIKVWATGLFAGIITPGRVGDFIRAFYLRRRLKSFGISLSTVIVDRIIDMVVVLLFAIVGIVLMNYWFGSSMVSFGLLSVFIIIILALLYLVMKKGVMTLVLRPFFRFLVPAKHKESARAGFHEFYECVGKLKHRKDGLLVVSIFTVLIWLFSILQIYVIGLAIGITFNYLFLLAVMSVVVIIELIPVSVSGLGTRELFLALSLSLIGIGAENAIAFSLLYMIIAYWSIAIMGLVFWVRDPVEISSSSS